MPTDLIFIVKFNTPAGPRYLEWSTGIAAPLTWGMTRSQFEAYYRDRYGWEGMRALPDRFKRVERLGTSSYDEGERESLVMSNQAGAHGAKMSLGQIVEYYCPPSLDHLPEADHQLCWPPHRQTPHRNLSTNHTPPNHVAAFFSQKTTWSVVALLLVLAALAALAIRGLS